MAKIKKKKKDKKVKDPVNKISEEELRAKAFESARGTLDEGFRYGAGIADKYAPPGTFGEVSAEPSQNMMDYLAALRARAQQAADYTPLEQEALAQMRAGLGGYTSPELQAQREMMLQGLNQDLATQVRLQQLAAARNRVRGAAASAQQMDLQQGAQRARGEVERDLFAKSADEIQARRAAFADLVSGTEANRNVRNVEFEKLLSGNLGGIEQMKQTANMFNVNQKGNEAMARASIASGAAGAFGGLVGGEQAMGLGINEANQAAQAQKVFQEQQNQLIRQQQEALRRQYSSLASVV